eukprot:85385-Rhodomonas_salina.2
MSLLEPHSRQVRPDMTQPSEQILPEAPILSKFCPELVNKTVESCPACDQHQIQQVFGHRSFMGPSQLQKLFESLEEGGGACCSATITGNGFDRALHTG